jgi:hypothetical protein
MFVGVSGVKGTSWDGAGGVRVELGGGLVHLPLRRGGDRLGAGEADAHGAPRLPAVRRHRDQVAPRRVGGEGEGLRGAAAEAGGAEDAVAGGAGDGDHGVRAVLLHAAGDEVALREGQLVAERVARRQGGAHGGSDAQRGGLLGEEGAGGEEQERAGAREGGSHGRSLGGVRASGEGDDGRVVHSLVYNAPPRNRCPNHGPRHSLPHDRRIFSIGRPLASSSTSLSM